jgi:hypothetical protein
MGGYRGREREEERVEKRMLNNMFSLVPSPLWNVHVQSAFFVNYGVLKGHSYDMSIQFNHCC